MKKILAVFTMLCTVASLSACGSPAEQNAASAVTTVSATQTTAIETTVTMQTTLTTKNSTAKPTEKDPESFKQPKKDGATVKVKDVPKKQQRSNGIDVSKWQGKINWKQVKQSGVDFAIIRIGYRGENGEIFKDETADYNLQQAASAGILTGVYFFSTATSKREAEQEAAFVINAIKGYSISYPVAYDCEGYMNPDSRMHQLSAASRTANANAFLNAIKQAGYDTMFYGAYTEITDPTLWDLSAIRAHHKIWVAQYPAVTYPKQDAPLLSGAAAWQYTNKGTVAGIEGDVDMVVCYFKKNKVPPKDASKKTTTAKAPLTDEEKQYTVVKETVTAKELVNLHSAASTDAKIVGTLKNGETLTRIAIGKNGWSKLLYKGKTVFAVSSYLTTDLTPKTTKTQDIVNGQLFTPHTDSVTAKEEVNLRTAPTTDSEIIALLKHGEFAERIAVSDKGWSRLLYDGKIVYAVTSYLTTQE